MEDRRVIDLVIEARVREVAGFSVRRTLPSLHRRAVGPFVFVDHFGPVAFPPGTSMDVKPHPHIGLATVTYLFEGEIIHRDSIGSYQSIRPGDVNWMTAGRGIAHSERGTDLQKLEGGRSHGLQLWVALPIANEGEEPTFSHHPEESLPKLRVQKNDLTVIAGSAYGVTSPVEVASPLFYVDVSLHGSLTLPNAEQERAAYVVSGSISIEDRVFGAGTMIVLQPKKEAALRVSAPGEEAHVMLLGGAKLDGERHIWWNFVASSKEKIENAKRDWKEGRFEKVVGDETEFVPLPEH